MEKKKKKRGDRRDAVWLRELDSLHQIMPYLYPNRTDNEAFISVRIDMAAINRYLQMRNADRAADDQIRLFQVLIAALVKTITLRPKLNRFIKGGRIYQRDVLSVGFVVKKKFQDEGKEALAYQIFDSQTTINTVHQRIQDEINSCRSEKADNSTAAMDTLVRMPRPILRFVMWVLHKLDDYGRVPWSLVKTDPNYATCFLTNLGSIGLKSAYHHLSNWGTNSLFVVVGEKKFVPCYDAEGNMQMREILDLGITLDERIADGYYYSKSIKLLQYLLQHPELLETPANEEVDIINE